MKLKINVHMYRVGFGDCFLVTFGSTEPKYRILFDCGRHAGSTPVEEEELAFESVIARLINDIPKTSEEGHDVRRIDIIVATHRHRDHVHGFSKTDLWKDIVVGEIWMPWLEDPEDQHARRLTMSQEHSARRALSALKALKAASGEPTKTFDSAIEIVYNSTTNKTAMEFLHRGLRADRRRFLPRLGYFPDSFSADQLGDRIPRGVTLHVLGPSRDPAVITSLQPPPGTAYEPLLHKNGLNVDEADEMEAGTAPEPFGQNWKVEADAYDLEPEERARIETAVINGAVSPLELAYRLDQSLNGTSLVIVIEAGDVKLLFAGDAQWGTWNAILRDKQAAAIVDGPAMYKVGHHGSHNATPIEFVDKHLREGAKSLVSVGPTNYGGGWQDIPLDSLLLALEKRGPVFRSDGDNPDVNAFVEIEFEADVPHSPEAR